MMSAKNLQLHGFRENWVFLIYAKQESTLKWKIVLFFAHSAQFDEIFGGFVHSARMFVNFF
jgi:hypothetical protein